MERWCDIGEQVVFEILLYLPVMSLLRFKRVCQSWFGVIESYTFMREQLDKYRREKGESGIIFGEKDVNGRGQLPVLSGRQYEDCSYIDCEQLLLWHPVKETECIGSCNGIVCVHRRNGTWSDGALWNPALKQLRRLPQPLLPSDGHTSQYHTALGIDASGDFKVVRIMWTYSKEWCEEDSVLLGNKAEVYSLRDNSWRITREDDALLFKILPCFSPLPVLLGGKCFWMAHDCHGSMMILSFDFDDEVFGTMALPALDSTDYCYYHYLDSCDDKLVYIRVQSDHHIYEIWILHEYGVHESWNRLCSPDLHHLAGIHVSGLSWNAEFLIGHRSDGYTGRLYLYNLNTQQGHFLQFVLSSLIAYTPSLFSLTTANAH